MNQPLPLSIAVAFLLTGCSAFKKSQTWQHVVENRVDQIAANESKDSYPDRLHAALAARQIEHKVVTYQYRFQTRLREEAVGTGRAVLYRDQSTPQSPWWMIDENSGYPVWVPNGQVERQVSFFLRHEAEVLAQQDYPAGSEGKTFDTAPALARPTNTPPVMFARARRTAPAEESRAGRSNWLVSVETRFEQIFRATHGTDFDRQSSRDREKMAILRQSFATRTAEL